ncbi:MAG: ribosome maturation factor RimP [Candidatus Dormibacteria bacterium]
MKMQPDVAELTELLRPALNQSGVELLDVQWGGGGHKSVLRLVVDRSGGVTLDDCERASKTASAVLDAYDPIASRYSLEVSSPGADRPVTTPEDWAVAVGRRVNVRYRVGEAERIVEGTLTALSADTALVEIRQDHRRIACGIPLADVLAARVTVAI